MDVNSILAIILIAVVVLAFILWYKGRKLKKEVAELKRGRIKTGRWHKLLVALGLRKKEKPPHAGFKKGDINIRVYRTCKNKKRH